MERRNNTLRMCWEMVEKAMGPEFDINCRKFLNFLINFDFNPIKRHYIFGL
jgi:hypothetical protein